jgi:serine/threonine protein kinase
MGDTIQYPHGVDRRDILGAGTTAIVARLDAVIKFATAVERPFMDREKRVYERLGHHNRVLRYYGNLGDNIILQYACHGSIRQYLAIQAKPLALSLQLRWVEQIAEAVAYVLSKNVLHGDISCNNVFVDHSLNIKLGDFAGSAIDEEPPLICYETSHEHPSIGDTSIKSEIFALGSTIYEIMTGSKPYKELSDSEICAAYDMGKYPELSSLSAFNDIIAKCWAQGYANVDELLGDIKAEGMNSTH